MKHLFKTHKEGFRLLKLIYDQNHSIIPLYMLNSFIESCIPFIYILFSADIIDALLTQRWKLAMYVAAVMLVLQFIFGVLCDLFNQKRETMSMSINRDCNAHVCLKTIKLDYETFEDKESLEQFEAADYNMARNGGFGKFLLTYSNLFKSIVSMLMGTFLLISLCLKQPKQITGLIGFITSLSGSFIIIIVLLISLILFYSRFASYVNDNSLTLFDQSLDVQQRNAYFMKILFPDPQRAKDIRLYNLKDLLLEEWKQIMMESHRFYRKQWNFDMIINLVSSFMGDAVLLFAYLFVTLKAYIQAISIGELSKYAGAIQQFNAALKEMVEDNDSIRILTSYLSYYTDYLQKENKLNTGTLPVEKRLDHVYELEFHDVSFHYPHSDEMILNHVSLKLDLKEKFALVGRNGAGKTTFIKLLCRLYDVSDGYITLNGIDIRKYDYKEYLNLFAAVFQDFSLFEFPIGENIACTCDYDEQLVWDVLERAGVKQRVLNMKHGLSTPLSSYDEFGEMLSGGEAQKIAIARALYKDAAFVILDEPTAALDPISEYEIYSRFDEMVEDKTSIYISHRMSSCRFCSDIVVFDKGSVVQRGNHDALMKDQHGIYAQMWNAQAKYYEMKQQVI